MISNIKVNRAVDTGITCTELADKVNTICRLGTTIITSSNSSTNNNECQPHRLTRHVPLFQVLLHPPQKRQHPANTARQLQPLALQARNLLQPRRINLITRNNTRACTLTGPHITTTCTSNTMVVIPTITRVTKVCIKVKDMEHRSMVVNKAVTTDSPAVINLVHTMHSVE